MLKDVLGYTLSEIAEIVGSSVGGVKTALHRGRGRVKVLRAKPVRPVSRMPDEQLVRRYTELFNARDWNGLRGLIRADARLEVVDRGEGLLAGDSYRTNYTNFDWEWRLETVIVDGEAIVVHFRLEGGIWVPLTALRVECTDGQVSRVRDYVHVEYVLC